MTCEIRVFIVCLVLSVVNFFLYRDRNEDYINILLGIWSVYGSILVGNFLGANPQ